MSFKKIKEGNLFWILFLTIQHFSLFQKIVVGIVGGKDAKIEDFPYVAQIQQREKQKDPWTNFCTAVILSEDWIITSALCLQAPYVMPYCYLILRKKIRSDITCTLITYISLITYIVKRQNNLHQLQLFHVQKLSNLHQFFSHKRLRWAMPWEKKGIKI